MDGGREGGGLILQSLKHPQPDNPLVSVEATWTKEYTSDS